MARILVADDDKPIVDLIRMTLEPEHHEIFEAFNGKEALEQIKTHEPDLAILDVMMPHMDGHTVSSMLLADESTRRIPIIIITARGQFRDLFELHSNVCAYIEKPFDSKTLRQKVESALKLKVK